MEPASLPAFRQHLQGRGYSHRTADEYRLKVRQFHAWLAGRELTAAALVEYRESLRARTSPPTVRQALAALSLWFSFLRRTGYAELLPLVPTPTPTELNRQGRRPRRREAS